MKLYVLRHGETTSNAGELIVGRSDVPLTEKGEEQARVAAKFFEKRDPSTTHGVTSGTLGVTSGTVGVTSDVILSERSESKNPTSGVILSEQSESKNPTSGVILSEQSESKNPTSGVILSEQSESKNLLPEVIFASPLIRAQKTAQILNEELVKSGVILKPLDIITEHRLIEQDYGKLEGQSRFLEEFAESKKQFADFSLVAESQLRLAARVYAFLDELKLGRPFDNSARNFGPHTQCGRRVTSDVILSERSEPKNLKSALLVTHGGICRIIHTYFYSMTIEEFAAWRAVNCEINEYDFV